MQMRIQQRLQYFLVVDQKKHAQSSLAILFFSEWNGQKFTIRPTVYKLTDTLLLYEQLEKKAYGEQEMFSLIKKGKCFL